jgi:hypothetical protein
MNEFWKEVWLAGIPIRDPKFKLSPKEAGCVLLIFSKLGIVSVLPK